MTTHALARLLLKNPDEPAVIDVENDGCLEEITGVIYFTKNASYVSAQKKGWGEFNKTCIKICSASHDVFGFEVNDD